MKEVQLFKQHDVNITALELIFTENTVPHLLSGKAVDSAIRRHQRVDIALHTILLEDIIRSTDIDWNSIK